MSFTFTGIITNATIAELAILACPFPLRKYSEPEELILIAMGSDRSENERYAKSLSAKLLERKCCVLEYTMWAGELLSVNGAVYVRGIVVPGSQCSGSKGDTANEAFMRILLEYGISTYEDGYFSPFDKRHRQKMD